MSSFNLEFDAESPAFDKLPADSLLRLTGTHPRVGEVCRILNVVMTAVIDHKISGVIEDHIGNIIGSWILKP